MEKTKSNLPPEEQNEWNETIIAGIKAQALIRAQLNRIYGKM